MSDVEAVLKYEELGSLEGLGEGTLEKEYWGELEVDTEGDSL